MPHCNGSAATRRWVARAVRKGRLTGAAALPGAWLEQIWHARSARLLSGHEPEIGLAQCHILRAEGLDVRTRVEVRRVRCDGDGVAVTALVDGREREVRAARL